MKILFILSIILLFACQNKTNNIEKVETSNSILNETVYVKYERGQHPHLEGIVNDSIPCLLLWDTGISEEVFILSDSLIGMYGDSVWVQVGGFRKKLKVIYSSSKDFFKIVGTSVALIGQDFFKGEIIEVSLSKNYLKEVKDLDAVKNDYTKIKIDKKMTNNLPITAYIQGKAVDGYVCIDTGNPGYLILNYKLGENNGIDLTNTVKSNATFANDAKASAHCIVEMDSINLNNTYMAKGEFGMTFMKYPNEAAMIGLLGCAFLDKFTFILDQKNYDLYLKPIDK
jgi:hypothetical protein